MSLANIAEILRADNADALLREVSAWQDIDQLLQPSNGEKATLAWIATNVGAEQIVKLLLVRGANVEFKANGMSVREQAMLKPQILKAMAAAGIHLTPVELACLFTSTLPSDIPTDEHYEVLHETAQLVQAGGFGDLITTVCNIRSAPIFSEKFGLYSSVPSTLGQIDKTIDDAAAILFRIVARALMILNKYDREIATAIKRHFREFRRNRAWLQLATARATEEICHQVAAAEGCYEDDINDAVRFLIFRYPVVAVAAADNKASTEEIKTGTKFEENCLKTLVNAGYVARRVGGSGDQGADLIASMSELSYAIQCKYYGEAVGNAAVQQVAAARSYYRTDFAVVCAPNGFTKSARSLAAATDTLLISPEFLHDLDRLSKLLG